MLVLFGGLFLLLLIGAPVFVAIGGSALFYMVLNGLSPLMAVQRMVAGVDSFTLLAVPFFILAAGLMNASEVTRRLYDFAHSMVAHWRGGLGHVNVYGSLIFSTMSGAAMADAAGLGAIELKAMRERGYDPRFAVGVTAASSILGPIIPPSLALVVYGFVANVSVGRLFLAGIMPGLLCAVLLHVAVGIYARFYGMPSEAKHGWAERGRCLIAAVPALMMPVIIVGGILMGVATPTEAAAAASLYALVLGVAVYRSLGPRLIVRVFRETFETTATLMIMVAASVLFGWVLVYENVARDFTALMLGFVSEPWQVMFVLIALLLLAGMFLDTIAIILIATPMLAPVLREFDIDPVQFGIVMILTLMVGLMTPPIGMILFVMSRLSGLGYVTTFVACIPFMLPIILALALIATFPGISLFLPEWAF
jgi:tripartite ATP-independent transporter DctM subunit